MRWRAPRGRRRLAFRVPGVAEPVEAPLDGRTFGHYEVSTWRTSHGDIDVIAGTPKRARGQLASFDELASRAHPRQAFGMTILVADLDDTIEAKETLNRSPTGSRCRSCGSFGTGIAAAPPLDDRTRPSARWLQFRRVLLATAPVLTARVGFL